MNTFGNVLRLTTFGESHGSHIGGVLDGFPAGLLLDVDFLKNEMQRRKPGQSALTTERNEDDEVQIISGLFEGRTTGTPLAFIIKNKDANSGDYDALKNVYRPSHADFTYTEKYGIRDHRGGGRSSARETAVRVAAGALCKLFLQQKGIHIAGYVSQVGPIVCPLPYTELSLSEAEQSPVRCPHAETAREMEAYISQIKSEGDTIGGTITAVIQGLPVGLGAPVYGKFHAALASAMLGINACKGFDYGSGFDSLHRKGSELNDAFTTVNQSTVTKTNHSGGIQGGITNGNDVYFRVAFKPVATIKREQQSVTPEGEKTTFTAQGRHDPCVLPRAVPIVEAMAALVTLDHWLLAQTVIKHSEA